MLNQSSMNNKNIGTKDIQAYINDIKRFPILSRDEEKQVAILALSGDKKACQKLIQSNLLLVVKVANEYGGIIDNLKDLIQEGSIGLMRAIPKYDPSKGIRFSSYALWYARAMMLRYMFENSHMIKPGGKPQQKRLFYNLRKEQNRLKQLGVEADSSIIAQNLGVDEKDVIDMDSRLQSDVFIDSPIMNISGHEEGVISDFIPLPSEKQPDSMVEDNDFRTELRKSLDKFAIKLKTDKYREIYFRRIIAEEPETLQLIADRLGVSKQRINQIEVMILEGLKKYLKSYNYRAY